MKKIDLGILVIELIITLLTSFNFITKEKVVDLGNLQINGDKNNYLSWSTVIGVVVIEIGGATYLT